DLGPNLDDRVERDRPGLLACGDVDVGWSDGVDVVLLERLLVVRGQRLAQCLRARRLRAQPRLEQTSGCLPRPEAGNADFDGDLAKGGIEGPVELALVDLDGELDLVSFERFDRGLHRVADCTGTVFLGRVLVVTDCRRRFGRALERAPSYFADRKSVV